MKHLIQITLAEAYTLARHHYNVDSDVIVDITDLPPVADNNPNTFSLSNRPIAQANKIALIKFMRQIILDSKNNAADADGSLAGAKKYVEKYFNC